MVVEAAEFNGSRTFLLISKTAFALHQDSANFFVKGHMVNILDSAGGLSYNYSTLWLLQESSHKQYLNKRSWL